MNSTSVHSHTLVASHSCTFKAILSFSFLLLSSFYSFAQDTGKVRLQADTSSINTVAVIQPDSLSLLNDTIQNDTTGLTNEQKKKRIRTVTIANIALYGGSLIILNQAWYADYERTSFHTFNDNDEWLQVDKVGHMYSAYTISRLSMEAWRWAGLERKQRIWIGGLSGVAYQTIIEVLDGFSAEWGWSWGDFAANVAGSSILIGQELGWNDQRIKLKFSFHQKTYSDPELNDRSDELFGSSLAERSLKDYNGQTYWASANLKSFLPQSKLPKWLSIAVGYGADGMFGARENIATDDNGNVTFDRTDIKRYRQWYLAPDVDFTKIKTNKKAVKFLFTILSCFKFPAPTLEFSNGKFKMHALYF